MSLTIPEKHRGTSRVSIYNDMCGPVRAWFMGENETVPEVLHDMNQDPWEWKNPLKTMREKYIEPQNPYDDPDGKMAHEIRVGKEWWKWFPVGVKQQVCVNYKIPFQFKVRRRVKCRQFISPENEGETYTFNVTTVLNQNIGPLMWVSNNDPVFVRQRKLEREERWKEFKHPDEHREPHEPTHAPKYIRWAHRFGNVPWKLLTKDQKAIIKAEDEAELRKKFPAYDYNKEDWEQANSFGELEKGVEDATDPDKFRLEFVDGPEPTAKPPDLDKLSVLLGGKRPLSKNEMRALPKHERKELKKRLQAEKDKEEFPDWANDAEKPFSRVECLIPLVLAVVFFMLASKKFYSFKRSINGLGHPLVNE
eukprot:gnl/TRDRNA2_/TRDRNA2_84835_c0_seq2.p1 gnl/TRDRNA2_/TRDRNA2_84835_c0~~gnl/TRDRNA2_/TRDRNA2_84835_c0_seq2.p1  ORF type:complete len:364 (+),score=58.96 gnl/TRDRNA2_/TRDRNA2_84835_c0_seq2:156-1247(+)